jgi:hypothetical protein
MRTFGGFAPATPGFNAFLPPLVGIRRRARLASSGSGPGIGARVASLRCPILRPVLFSLRQLSQHVSRILLRDGGCVG